MCVEGKESRVKPPTTLHPILAGVVYVLFCFSFFVFGFPLNSLISIVNACWFVGCRGFSLVELQKQEWLWFLELKYAHL